MRGYSDYHQLLPWLLPTSLIISVSASRMELYGVESDVYSKLAVGRYKEKNERNIGVLSAWLKFMLMRRRGRLVTVKNPEELLSQIEAQS